MSVFFKRNKWWGRKDGGECKRFATEEEAYAFTGEEMPKKSRPKPTPKKWEKKVVKTTLGDSSGDKTEIKEEEAGEETNTYEQETVFFGKSFGKKKI